MNAVCQAAWKSDRVNPRKSDLNELNETFVHLALIKGLLLIVVLSVDTAAINTSVTHLQTSNQESAELAKANELSNGAVKLYNAESSRML